MPGNFKKDDLRIIKTYKALTAAVATLLARRNFGQITVNDLCEEAQISRATFYSHFNDKYDLLRYCSKVVENDFINNLCDYKQLEAKVNDFVSENSKVITNLVWDCNAETIGILRDFMSSIIYAVIAGRENSTGQNHIILSNFCSGGMAELLIWQVKNKFPSEHRLMNTYFYKMMEAILDWDENQE